MIRLIFVSFCLKSFVREPCLFTLFFFFWRIEIWLFFGKCFSTGQADWLSWLWCLKHAIGSKNRVLFVL